MKELHIEVEQGKNAAEVDLFDERHARKILIAFGRAFGTLSDRLTRDQELFIERSVKEIAEEGLIYPVRLSLFAWMVRDTQWSQATLKSIGGAKGVGVRFLEKTFSSTTMNRHRNAAKGMLQALLPEEGTEIKGRRRSVSEMSHDSGYENRPAEFDDLVKMLDGEFRLITPTTSYATEVASEALRQAGHGSAERYDQLTHDYMVPRAPRMA